MLELDLITLKQSPEACNFLKKQTLTQVFSCEFCEISKSNFSYRTPPVAASDHISVKVRKFTTFGDKSLATSGPNIGNALPQNMKAENSYVKFKEYTATWFGSKCKCNVWSFNNS